MGTTANTSSYIYKPGTTPNTRTVVSQKSKVFGYTVGAKGFQQLGVISEFGFDESREISPVRGVGYGDHIAELVPGNTEPMKLTLNKTMLYTANVFQIVGYKGGIDGLVRSLRHHRWPFDVKHELVFSELSSKFDPQGVSVAATVTTGPTGPDNPIVVPQALMTYFEGCWFDAHSASFTADTAIVLENASCTVTDVIDGTSQYGEYMDTGLAPVVDNGAPGAGFSLRFAGTLNATFPTQ